MEAITLANAMLTDIRNKDHYSICRNGVPISLYISTMINYIYLISNAKTYGRLMKIMKNDYKNISKMDRRCRAVVINWINKSTWILKCWLIVVTAAVVIFVIKSICLSIYYAVNGEFKFVSFHETHYPEFIEKHKYNNAYVFALTYMAELYFTSLNAVVFLCHLPIGPLFMLHACGQLELVIIKFEDIFKRDNVEERLNDTIKDLQHIYS